MLQSVIPLCAHFPIFNFCSQDKDSNTTSGIGSEVSINGKASDTASQISSEDTPPASPIPLPIAPPSDCPPDEPSSSTGSSSIPPYHSGEKQSIIPPAPTGPAVTDIYFNADKSWYSSSHSLPVANSTTSSSGHSADSDAFRGLGLNGPTQSGSSPNSSDGITVYSQASIDVVPPQNPPNPPHEALGTILETSSLEDGLNDPDAVPGILPPIKNIHQENDSSESKASPISSYSALGVNQEGPGHSILPSINVKNSMNPPGGMKSSQLHPNNVHLPPPSMSDDFAPQQESRDSTGIPPCGDDYCIVTVPEGKSHEDNQSTEEGPNEASSPSSASVDIGFPIPDGIEDSASEASAFVLPKISSFSQSPEKLHPQMVETSFCNGGSPVMIHPNKPKSLVQRSRAGPDKLSDTGNFYDMDDYCKATQQRSDEPYLAKMDPPHAIVANFC